MKYPKLLQVGDTIGICAPSSGISENHYARLDKAVSNVEALGYKIIETKSVRNRIKCVSADAKTRAAEFMTLYRDSSVATIIPPWGGEFLMDMLPYIDYDLLSSLPAKWVSGYSDISTLTFVLTVKCDIAAIHGSNFMNMGYKSIHETDLQVFEAMSNSSFIQNNAPYWGGFKSWVDISGDIYDLSNENRWKTLDDNDHLKFSGRMIGGCMDTLCKLIGTQYAPVDKFIEKYKADGFIWTLESCEMNAGDIYRTLWQMRESGWFKYCNGIIYGRPDGYSDTNDFTLIDALKYGFDDLNVPVIYGADIGHVPPQIQVINGSFASVVYKSGHAKITQEMK